MNIIEIKRMLETFSDEQLVEYTTTNRFDGCPSPFIGELWKRHLDLKNKVIELERILNTIQEPKRQNKIDVSSIFK